MNGKVCSRDFAICAMSSLVAFLVLPFFPIAVSLLLLLLLCTAAD